MLDQEFFIALGGLMRSLREFETDSGEIFMLVCEEVLECLSSEHISVNLTNLENMKECLFDKSPEYPNAELAFEGFKTMLVERDFRVSDSLLEALRIVFEKSIERFRPINQRDQDLIKMMVSELRRL